MAGDWIKMRVGLSHDLNVTRIARSINHSDFLDTLAPDCQLGDGACNAAPLQLLVVGALYRFWCAAQEATTDGTLHNCDLNDIDLMVGVNGFAQAIVDVGWLVVIDDDTLQVPSWHKHNGDGAKSRAMGQKRSEKHRETQRNSVTPCNANVTQERYQRREEKRREEEKKNTPPTPQGGESPRKAIHLNVDHLSIYQAYPRHIGRVSAMKAIAKALERVSGSPEPPEDPVAFLRERAATYAGLVKGKTEERFIPHAATWFNDERYLDDMLLPGFVPSVAAKEAAPGKVVAKEGKYAKFDR